MTTAPKANGVAPPRRNRPTKYSRPRRPPDLLRRPHLLDFLHEHANRKLLLISAAAGYGKSSLLLDFAHDTDFHVAWLRLDEGDRDLAVLLAGLVKALQHTFPKFESMVTALAGQSGASPQGLAGALNREVESALDEYFVLALDDFHLVEDSAPVRRFFDALLTDLPEQAHLVVAGRTIPPLRIASLAARQQIAGLSEEHLRFKPEEVQALLQMRNSLSLPEAEAERLVASTEGWITGILLSTHLMWQGLMSSLLQARRTEGPLYDYLATEVLDQQPEFLRQFLTESAVLPEMEPAVCDAVLGRSDSAQLLRMAEDRHLFVSAVGDEFRAYQYHHLFRDFLVARLRAGDPARLQALQMRAAGWYAENGMPEAAVTYYILAGDLGQAAAVAEASAATLFRAGRHATLRRWAEQLATVSHDVPTLHLYVAVADLDSGEAAAAEGGLALAALGYARRSDRAGSLRVETQRSLLLYKRGAYEQARALAAQVVLQARAAGLDEVAATALRYAGLSHFALGQLAAAEEAFGQARQLLQSTDLSYSLAWTLSDLALVLRARGETARAAQAQREALTLWRDAAAIAPLSLALNNIAWDLHMLGQYEAALETYAEALEWALRAGNAHWEAMILAGRADVFADLGDRAAAADLYRQTLRRVEKSGDREMAAYVYRGLARLDRWSGNFVSALEWLRRASLTSPRQAQSPLANVGGVQGIILVEMGHVRDGRETLIRVCAELEGRGASVDLAQALLFRACAEFRDEDPDAAAASLAQAFTVAERVGYDQMLLSEVSEARALLEACRVRPDIGPRCVRLLARAEAVGAVRARLAEAGPGAVPDLAEALAPEAHLEVRAFGSTRVLRAGREIPRQAWESARARELFVFLVDRAPITRDKVLDVFWPDKTPARAAANLYQTLYRLRKAIGFDAAVIQGQECRLAAGLELTYDVAQFEAQARTALAHAAGDLRRLEALSGAVALYTGEYLADVLVDWALARRQELCALYVIVLGAYADELMRLTRLAEAREVVAKGLAMEPLRDDLHQRMLVCLAGLSRPHEVVDHYRRYRDALRSEMGLDPPPETRALYARLIE